MSSKIGTKLSRYGLTETDANTLGIKLLPPADTEKRVKWQYPSLFIPYFSLDGDKTNFYRLRILDAPARIGFGDKDKIPKYTQPANELPRFYLPPICPEVTWADIADDTQIEIVITEGEFKAACACKHGFATIGLGGVYSWKSKKRRKPVIDDFKLFKWVDRTVYLIFDSDLATNIMVQKALRELSDVLVELGAQVYVGYLPALPEFDGKVGIDDFIIQEGADKFENVLMSAEPYDMSKELWSLNNDVAYIRDPGFIVVQDTNQIITPTDFTHHAYSTRSYTIYQGDTPVSKPAAPAWLKWPHRFELRKLVYKPGSKKIVDGKYFNVWPGWGVEPKPGDVSPWKKLLDLIFGKDKKGRDWFEKWCAYQFQNPGVKLYTSVLFWGVIQGSGKSMVGLTLGKIFGDNFSEIGHDDLHGPYNDWAANKQFILGDEITGSDKRNDADRLKKLITQSKININVKYVKIYEIDDCCNYFLTSNNPNALYMDDDDRRFFVKEITSKYDPDFYLSVYDPWLHGDGPSHLFHYFLNKDVSGFNPKAEAPANTDKFDMIHIGKSDMAFWVHELRNNPDDVLKCGSLELKGDLFDIQQLLRLYDPDQRTGVTKNGLGRALKQGGVNPLSPIKVGKTSKRLYVVRNWETWRYASPKKIVEHYTKHFGIGTDDKTEKKETGKRKHK